MWRSCTGCALFIAWSAWHMCIVASLVVHYEPTCFGRISAGTQHLPLCGRLGAGKLRPALTAHACRFRSARWLAAIMPTAASNGSTSSALASLLHRRTNGARLEQPIAALPLSFGAVNCQKIAHCLQRCCDGLLCNLRHSKTLTSVLRFCPDCRAYRRQGGVGMAGW